MILAEDLEIMNWNSNMNLARSEGRNEGRSEGQDRIVELNKWLFSQGRAEDIQRYTDDPEYLDALLKEYASFNTSVEPK